MCRGFAGGGQGRCVHHPQQQGVFHRHCRCVEAWLLRERPLGQAKHHHTFKCALPVTSQCCCSSFGCVIAAHEEWGHAHSVWGKVRRTLQAAPASPLELLTAQDGVPCMRHTLVRRAATQRSHVPCIDSVLAIWPLLLSQGSTGMQGNICAGVSCAGC